MPMSSSHAPVVWFQWLSFGLNGPGSTVFKSIVDADAAKPQRAGVSQDSWSSTARSVTGIIPLENTNWAMIATTSNGRIWSLDRASADRTSPIIADTTHVDATATNNSKLPFPRSTAPWVGAPLPSTAMSVAIADWMI